MYCYLFPNSSNKQAPELDIKLSSADSSSACFAESMFAVNWRQLRCCLGTTAARVLGYATSLKNCFRKLLAHWYCTNKNNFIKILILIRVIYLNKRKNKSLVIFHVASEYSVLLPSRSEPEREVPLQSWVLFPQNLFQMPAKALWVSTPVFAKEQRHLLPLRTCLPDGISTVVSEDGVLTALWEKQDKIFILGKASDWVKLSYKPPPPLFVK